MISVEGKSKEAIGCELYTLVCDRCGKTFYSGDCGRSSPVPGLLRRKATDSGWTCSEDASIFYSKGKDYCEKCKEINNMGHLTDYANRLIDKSEARKKELEDKWSKIYMKACTSKSGSDSTVPLVQIPLKTVQTQQDAHPDEEKNDEAHDTQDEPIDEVIRFGCSTIVIYPGMDK